MEVHLSNTGVTIEITAPQFERLADSLRDGIKLVSDLNAVVGEYGEKLRAQAVFNVSGNTVTWSGGTFVVNRVTGKLARSISVSYSPLAATVRAGAEYAAAVEAGHGPIDLKKTMMGKVIPIRLNDQAAAGASGVKVVKKRATTGRAAGHENIIFRRVGKTGWIIPAKEGRPFMQAAGEVIEPRFQEAVLRVFQRHIEGAGA